MTYAVKTLWFGLVIAGTGFSNTLPAPSTTASVSICLTAACPVLAQSPESTPTAEQLISPLQYLI